MPQAYRDAQQERILRLPSRDARHAIGSTANSQRKISEIRICITTILAFSCAAMPIPPGYKGCVILRALDRRSGPARRVLLDIAGLSTGILINSPYHWQAVQTPVIGGMTALPDIAV